MESKEKYWGKGTKVDMVMGNKIDMWGYSDKIDQNRRGTTAFNEKKKTIRDSKKVK